MQHNRNKNSDKVNLYGYRERWGTCVEQGYIIQVNIQAF